MVFYYARHQFIYSHDINSYYRWFVLKTFGNAIVSLIDALPKFRNIKVPWRPVYVALIKCALICFYKIYFLHGYTMYCSWPCLFTAEHGYTLLRKISYIWEISCLVCRCFSNSCVHKPSFSITPWSLKSIITKSVIMK